MKIDLHTHSIASPDGGLTLANYRKALETGTLDYIAITDHNTIVFALEAQRELGERIIVGEEITAKEGEIIGLYLKEAIPAGLSVAETVAAIKAQNGLVYIPHPFETVRKGLPRRVLDTIANDIDIIEVFNGRALLPHRSRQARKWAGEHTVSGAASSDAHGNRGWGRTFSILGAAPSRSNLVTLLADATYSTKTVGGGVVYPKLNRLRRRRAR